MSDEDHRGWLPPQAPGGAPPPQFDKDQPQPPAPPTPPPQPPPQQYQPAPPPPADPGTSQPPPADGGAYPADPPPSWPLRNPAPPAQYGQQPYGQQQPGQPPPTFYAQPGAGNGAAIAGFVLGISGLVLFLLGGFGLLFILNLPCSIMAWIFGVQGKRKIARGQTSEHRSLAQWAVGLGIAGTVIGVLAAIGWIVGLATSEELRDELEKQIDEASENNTIRLVRVLGTVAAAVLRGTLG
jgi:hypothetical protein